jgi:uncharacterized membrane protein YhaH (DUF805 family)
MYDDRKDDGETTIILAFARTGLHYLNLKGRRRRRRRMMMMIIIIIIIIIMCIKQLKMLTT